MKNSYSFILKLSFTILLISIMSSAHAGNAPAWKWLRGYDSIANPAGVGAMKIDKNGFIYQSGGFYGSICYLGSFTVLRQDTTTFPLPGCNFISKLDSFGNILWANAYGSTAGGSISNAGMNIIDLDSAGNIYITGTFYASLRMNGQTLLQAAGNAANVFVIKMTPSGTVVWAKSIYAIPSSSIQEPILALDKANNIVMAMTVTGTDQLVSGTDTLSLSGSPGEQLALYKLNANGTQIFSKSYYTDHQSLQPSGICIDSGNNILLSVAVSNVNQIAETIQLDNISLSMSPIFQGGGILFRFSPGGTCLWGTLLGGWSFTSTSNGGSSISVSSDRYIYAAGYYNGDTALFGSTTLANTMPGYNKAYLAKYDLSGNLIWTNVITQGNTQGGNLVIDNQGNCYLSGTFSDTFLTVNNISIHSDLTNFGTGHNNFIIMYDKNGNAIWGKGYGWPTETLGPSSTPAIFGNSVYEAGGIPAAYFDGVLIPYYLFLGKLGNTFSLSASSINMNCSDSCTGTATASVTGQTGPVNYSWTPGNYTTASISGLCAGTYTCVALDSVGNHDTTVVAVSVLHTSPTAPAISSSGDTLNTVSGYAEYQWIYNNIILSADTTQIIQTSQNGNYTVAVTDSNGCSSISAPYAFTNTGVAVTTSDYVRLYPNPSNGEFFIRSYVSVGAAYTISDLSGQMIQQGVLTGEFTPVTLPSDASGVYTITFPGLSDVRPVRLTVIR
jgi:hypothetical protein